jgi:hypothetical protein
MARNLGDQISIKVINDKELLKLFQELIPSEQNKIVRSGAMRGMREGGKIILDQAKSNFRSRQKNKSTTGYSYFNKSFKMESMKKGFGLNVGIKNYKMKWGEEGTKDRSYKKGVKKSLWRKTANKSDGHSTGKIEAGNFFKDAVLAKQSEAQGRISQAIVDSLERTVDKYNKN